MKTRILLFLCIFSIIALNVKAEDGKLKTCANGQSAVKDLNLNVDKTFIIQ
jgi:hypothetical protein